MPEMDGFEFLHELRGRQEWRDVPVVVLTAKELTPDDHNRLRHNVERILRKGDTAREGLVAEVHRLVRRRVAGA
jgi:CheY-like chemotaxis protein